MELEPPRGRRLRSSTPFSAEYIRTDLDSGHFFVKISGREDWEYTFVYPVIFTNGSCLANGRKNPRVGIGIAAGTRPYSYQQVSEPLSNISHIPYKRKSQRAKLFGAIEGVSRALDLVGGWRDSFTVGASVIIATDSMYVVDGITELLPKWKARGWMTSKGRRPKNLDLFQELEKRVIDCEKKHGIDVLFLWVPHDTNRLACRLSNSAAKRDAPGHFAGGRFREDKAKAFYVG
ncbi:ribonuclease H-like domain-containing protein [Phyllosticta citribraziliensis]|uniref:ribonuclease H n=1 Tax=Phyllosticta citribraziliensis TaxID=989973 RepID=A0ABR1LGC5_9PEZI